MGNNTRMDQIKLLVKTYLRTNSKRATARICNLSKNTVKNYIKVLKSVDKPLSFYAELSDEELKEILVKTQEDRSDDNRKQTFELHVPEWLRELKRKGVTQQLLWHEYKQKYGKDIYSYSQFCDKLSHHIKKNKLSLCLCHTPGEVMQMDFAGTPMSWVDRVTGEIHKCEIFVAVMPFSQHTFAIALPSQKVSDFVHAINQAMLFFGCRPKVLLCDNLKSYVIKADRYNPTFNQLTVQLAEHFELELRATRVAKPKDKASVEGAVKICYQRIHAPLRNETFHSLEELNDAIAYQLDIHNALPYQKKQGSRKLHFEDYERPHMRELPSELFVSKNIAKATIQKNYHVHLSEYKLYFSVPYRYVGEKAMVRYDSKTVEIFVHDVRICTHSINSTYMKYYTLDKHLPSTHLEWKKSKGYDADHYRRKAKDIGDNTLWLIQHILSKQSYEVQAFKTCAGVLALSRDYTPYRLEQAAMRCKSYQHGNLTTVRNILSKNLDQKAMVRQLNIPEHDNIRGEGKY